MRISKAAIHNYRSFEDISVVLLPYTVVIGQNNVGKSNILRALELFFNPPFAMKMRFFRSQPIREFQRSVGYEDSDRAEAEFNYERDFPVASQGSPGQKRTVIKVTFVLDRRDFDQLELDRKFEKYRAITVTQIIRIEKNKADKLTYQSDKLKHEDLLEFLHWTFRTSDFVRIPSSRRDTASQRLLRKFSKRIYATLRTSHKVKRSLEALAERARKEIRRAEKEISNRLVQFIPELKSVMLELSDLPEISDILGISNIKIDDGTLTFLANKGDGVQSLFFLGLVQYMASLKVNRNLIFGIEEPELHLHPDAQEKLRRTLRAISQENQVILTTHSPVLVDHSSVGNNIVVTRDERSNEIRCISRPNLHTIRSVLGVKPSHNLINALLVLVVEGTTDKRLAEHIISLTNSDVRSLLESGELKIEHNRGADGAMDYLNSLKRQLQPRMAIFDADGEGLKAANECIDSGLLEQSDLFVVPSREAFSETEMEDLFPIGYTLAALKEAFNIEIGEEEYKRYQVSTGSKGRKPGKWSEVVTKILN